MSKARKVDIIAKAKTEFLNSGLMICFKYHGLNTKRLESLRKTIRKINGESGVFIIKNTLFKLVMPSSLKEELDIKCKGPIAIIYTKKDPIILTKIVEEFFNEIKKAVPKVTMEYCIIDNQVHTTELLKIMSSYSSTDALKAEFLGLLEEPLSSFLATLEAPAAELINTLKAKEDKENSTN
ncbi:MAG: 50S ribosomal protein L10 [Rickettsiales bacterium]